MGMRGEGAGAGCGRGGRSGHAGGGGGGGGGAGRELVQDIGSEYLLQAFSDPLCVQPSLSLNLMRSLKLIFVLHCYR
jgi:hypothetical protein